ncbi:DUF6368 family protein [Streptomyces sp. NPDC008139]|uniref:DUF6368 family protein n=1 Tax=Streptomyces sp. NPDC008139 TaxID=3364814 RepID=UPI0036E0EF19
MGDDDSAGRAPSHGRTGIGDRVGGGRPRTGPLLGTEHADEVYQEPLMGPAPTHAVDVVAFWPDPADPADHVAPAVAALLTAAVMDVAGGVANAELREDQLPIAAVLPGILAVMTEPWT